MEDLQDIIFAAWRRVAPSLAEKPELLARRLQRRRTPVLTRPPRAWCLAVRACDHRIASGCEEPMEHRVTLTRELVCRVCAPVRLDAPGEPLADVAKKLGTTKSRLTKPRIKGVFRTHYIPPTMGRGRPVPLLYSEKQLDSSARNFAGAEEMWTWTGLFRTIYLPHDFEQTVTRVPIFRAHVSKHRYEEDRHPEIDGVAPARRSYRLPPPPPDGAAWYKWSRSGHFLGTDPSNWRKRPWDLGERPRRDLPKRKDYRKPKPSTSSGSLHFNGFLWICPCCGRTCRTLYRPAPPMHLLERVEPRIARCVDIKRTGIEGKFACKRCHRVRFVSAIAPGAWNQLIAYLTAGLLYGTEVPKPAWFVPRRKRAYRPIMRPAPRREQVRRRLLEGWTVDQIAEEMRITRRCVRTRMKEIFAMEGVADRMELARKLGSQNAQPLNLRQRARERRKRVGELILRGWSDEQIREELRIGKVTMWMNAKLFFDSQGVRGRRELERKLAVGLRQNDSLLGTDKNVCAT